MTQSAPPRRSAILFIDSLKIGGAERVTVQWAAWLLEAGWSVTLLTSKSSNHDFYPVSTGLRRLQEPSSQGLLNHALFWPLKLWRLRTLLRREQPDVLIGMTTLPSIKLALASIGLPSRLVLSERNYPPARPLAWRWRLFGVWRIPELICTWCKRRESRNGFINVVWLAAQRFAQFDRLAATALAPW